LLLGSRLRPGNAMGARQLVPLLRPMIKRLRANYRRRPIAIRADSAFANSHLLRLAERHDATYAIGIARNPVFEREVADLCAKAEKLWEKSGERVRLYMSFYHKTRSWAVERRIVAKIERTAEGMNRRFVVTNRSGED